ncbi:uncharacterized protein BX664DRAFT_367576 [Halteromyces radiatus]|uniref:uncharacterized protein n=1 Tax=Halteromyces radiatus TaxID=101107 RepID=UPI002220E24C|nr:uncharacterized protein BX664DRAFT_367576 [Halteromyces radiatus]KAI8098675.1 hypothetical protein BX664DRAFT_367576 [Halteromyces radiatus]
MVIESSQNEKGPKWKNEVTVNHSFDYVDLDEFYDRSCSTRLGYLMVYVLVIKSFLVYVADFWSAVSLLVLGQQNSTLDSAIPTEVSKWIFLGAIIISFLLLIWDVYKSKKVIATRDIAYAFTSTLARRYLSLRDYRCYSLFSRINETTKRIDSYAFFVFFTLKGWKRLLLAEAPRQIINIVTLKALVPQWIQINKGTLSLDNTALGHSVIQQLLTISMAFSTLVFAISFTLVCIAATMYLPLLCHIRGNLKEYVCHKVDKRIAALLQQQVRRRQLGLGTRRRAHKPTVGRSKTLNGQKPTLPKIDLEEESIQGTPFLPYHHHHQQQQQQQYHYPSPYMSHSPYIGYYEDSDRIGLTSNYKV